MTERGWHPSIGRQLTQALGERVVDDFRYPRADAVLLGLCPPDDLPEPVFGRRQSVSATRMDSLMPGWRSLAVGANAWWTHSEWAAGSTSMVDRVLSETGCRVVIALGRGVQRELGLPPGPYYEWGVVRGVRVLRFPHPSGLSRHWNELENRDTGARALRRALGGDKHARYQL